MTTDAMADLESRRRRTRLSVRLWSAAQAQLIVAGVVMLLVVSCSSEDTPREYSDEELGLQELVEKHIVVSSLWVARYRTLDDMDRDLFDPFVHPTSGSGHELERAFFEFLFGLAMWAASESLPPDVAFDGGILHDAEEAAMDQCAADAGYPGVQVYDVSNNVVELYERDFGLTLEMFWDLRHECGKYAATYPTLDPVYRHELLAKRRAHYMAVVRDWMAANPDLVVPIEYHEGANTPHADRFADS